MATKVREDLEPYERRAALAEEQIKLLAQRIEALEQAAPLATVSSSSAPAADTSAQQLLEKKLEEQTRLIESLTAENKKLLEELSGLKKENERNEYRIHILVRSLSDEQQKGAHLEEQLKHLSSK